MNIDSKFEENNRLSLILWLITAIQFLINPDFLHGKI